jgi:hypothetical protein
MYRDRKLLDLAENQECLMRLHSYCMKDQGSTTVAAHDNSLQSGKGMSLKADDSRTVWACYPCHTLFDQGKMDYDDKIKAFELAYTRQIAEWIKIAQNPCLKPWRVEAAQKVLNHLGVIYG